MSESNRRKYQRIDKKLNLICRKIGDNSKISYTGYTVNVSTGGLYFEIEDDVFSAGNLLDVKLSIPPTEGLLEFGGKISGLAKVIRTNHIGEMVPSRKHGVAIEFCDSVKLCN